jgi:hypothetical protein
MRGEHLAVSTVLRLSERGVMAEKSGISVSASASLS